MRFFFFLFCFFFHHVYHTNCKTIKQFQTNLNVHDDRLILLGLSKAWACSMFKRHRDKEMICLDGVERLKFGVFKSKLKPLLT